jgi:putative holliday junction resolvase
MARVLGIDYGLKRTGIATTDTMQIIASALTTVDTKELFGFITSYTEKEPVEKIVIGMPMHKDGNHTYLKKYIDEFADQIKKIRPSIDIDFYDESYTSVEAKAVILQSGVKKKKRQDKSLVDKVSALLILQKYLKHI